VRDPDARRRERGRGTRRVAHECANGLSVRGEASRQMPAGEASRTGD